MARGESGRIVLEVDPAFKVELYSALTRDGHTLKSWFLASAENYLRERDQLQLFSSARVAEDSAEYKTAPPSKDSGRGEAEQKKQRP